MSEIDDLRTEIAELDKDIMQLVGKRIAIAKKIGDYKRHHGLPVIVPEVETVVKKRYADESRKSGVPEPTAEAIADTLISACRRVQE